MDAGRSERLPVLEECTDPDAWDVAEHVGYSRSFRSRYSARQSMIAACAVWSVNQ